METRRQAASWVATRISTTAPVELHSTVPTSGSHVSTTKVRPNNGTVFGIYDVPGTPVGIAFDDTSNTVRNHMNSIIEKLEVSDRTEAATTAIQRGIIEVPG